MKIIKYILNIVLYIQKSKDIKVYAVYYNFEQMYWQ